MHNSPEDSGHFHLYRQPSCITIRLPETSMNTYSKLPPAKLHHIGFLIYSWFWLCLSDLFCLFSCFFLSFAFRCFLLVYLFVCLFYYFCCCCCCCFYKYIFRICFKMFISQFPPPPFFFFFFFLAIHNRNTMYKHQGLLVCPKNVAFYDYFVSE